MNLKLKEALGFLGTGIFLFLLIFYFSDFILAVVEFAIYAISVILILAGAGMLSDIINKPKVKKE